jgi:hypothetical protein
MAGVGHLAGHLTERRARPQGRSMTWWGLEGWANGWLGIVATLLQPVILGLLRPVVQPQGPVQLLCDRVPGTTIDAAVRL